jgi:hypothetical protein
VEGPPAGQVGEGGSSPELLADGKGRKTGMAAAFSDEVGDPVAGVVLRRGGKEVGGSGAGIPREKGSKGVLGALLTMEWVTTAEAGEAPVIGRLLTKSSYTDGGEGGEGRWSASEKNAALRRHGEGGGATAISVEERSGTGARRARTVRQRRSDTRGREAL